MQDAKLHNITLIYPQLLFELLGEELYTRCDQAIGSLDPDAAQRAIKELQEALYNSTAFTTGFQCCVSLGWKGAVPGPDRLQSIFLRPADPRNVEVATPDPSTWQLIPKQDHTVYAVRVEQQTWGPTPKKSKNDTGKTVSLLCELVCLMTDVAMEETAA